MACQENKVWEVSPARKDAPDAKDHAALPANPDDSFQSLDRKDQLEPQERPESLDPRDNLDRTVNLSKDRPDFQETQAPLDAKDVPDQRVQPARPETKERREAASTARRRVPLRATRRQAGDAFHIPLLSILVLTFLAHDSPKLPSPRLVVASSFCMFT